MKRLFNNIKEELGRIKAGIKEAYKNNEDNYTSFMILAFYCFLSFAAIMCLLGAVCKMGFLYILGVYFSVRILVNFVKDFTELIHKYIVDKNKNEVKEDSGK